MTLNNNRRGQGMVEYIIIVVVVGIFCIGIFMALGKGVQSQVAQSTQKLTGATAHNTALNNTNTTQRVTTENGRANLMTGN